jgi:hypothetical protein
MVAVGGSGEVVALARWWVVAVVLVQVWRLLLALVLVGDGRRTMGTVVAIAAHVYKVDLVIPSNN